MHDTAQTLAHARNAILGVNVSMIDAQRAVEMIGQWVARRQRTYVCVANTHLLMECHRDPVLRDIHNRAGMVTPDGMPLVWVGKMRGYDTVDRVYGPDLLLNVCRSFISLGMRHYFYGGAPGVAEKMVERLRKDLGDVQVAGVESPPFRPLGRAADEDAVRRINASNADIVWVGLGAPKQEHWMAQHRPLLEAPVLIGVGAAFDFHAGAKPQAARWVQRCGMEWAFRLACEPRRLWRRYAINNPLFVMHLLRETLSPRKVVAPQ